MRRFSFCHQRFLLILQRSLQRPHWVDAILAAPPLTRAEAMPRLPDHPE
jgi:hypothetical protein